MPLFRPRVVRSDKPGPNRVMVAAGAEDPTLTAVLKWIPLEVITAYKVVIGPIPVASWDVRFWLSVGFLLLTPLWIGFATQPTGGRVAWRQVIIAPFAFACWVVAMQADVVQGLFPGWELWMGSVVLGLGTVLLPIFDGILRALGVPQN